MSKTKLSLKEIAKCVRSDIKAAIKSGDLPQGLKVSVRIDHYSMGCSLDVNVTAMPEDKTFHNPKNIAFFEANKHAPSFHYPEDAREQYTPEMMAILAKLEAIVDVYHDDRSYSEPGGDRIYIVNFSKNVGIYWELRHSDRERVEAKLAAERAAAELAAAAPIEAPAPKLSPAEKPRFRVLAICVPVEE